MQYASWWRKLGLVSLQCSITQNSAFTPLCPPGQLSGCVRRRFFSRRVSRSIAPSPLTLCRFSTPSLTWWNRCAWLRGVQCDVVRKIQVSLCTQRTERYSALLHIVHPIPNNYKLSEPYPKSSRHNMLASVTFGGSRFYLRSTQLWIFRSFHSAYQIWQRADLAGTSRPSSHTKPRRRILALRPF